nr:MAG TPA: DNA adenine methylase [Caudoviricetes sp.]
MKLRTPITYYRDEQGLFGRIISMIPRHRIYCETFFGGRAVLFVKEK